MLLYDITVDYTNLIYWGISQSTRAKGQSPRVASCQMCFHADHCQKTAASKTAGFFDVDLADRSSKIMNQLY